MLASGKVEHLHLACTKSNRRIGKHTRPLKASTMRYILFSCFAALLAIAAPTPSFSQAQQNFALVNRSGTQIDEVYVSPSSSNDWGRDILGDGVLPSGNRRNVRFPQRTTACKFDLRVVFANGQKSEAGDLDLCSISTITVTPNGRFTTE